MAMPGEYEFYAARSGLSASASLTEHQRAYWATELGLSAAMAREKTTTELAWLFYRVNTLDTQAWYSLGDLQFRYFQQESGLPAGLTVNDYMAHFFVNPPPEGPVIVDTNYFRNPNGSGAYSWPLPTPGAWTEATEVSGGPVPGATWQKYTATAAVGGVNTTVYLTQFNASAEPVVGGQQYARGVYLISSAAIPTAGFLTLTQYRADGSQISNTADSQVAYPTPDVWLRITPPAVVVAADCAFIATSVRFNTLTLPIGGYVGIGGAKLAQAATVGEFFSGDTADDASFQYDWAGTPNDSVSTKGALV